MSAGVFGELTADGKDIVLFVTGNDHELDRAAAALRKMTVACKPTDPKGGLIAPATWAVVCQLGRTFNGGTIGQWMPGPGLQAWIMEELLRRAAMTITPLEPVEGFTPRAYQLEGAALIAATGKALVFDDPGCGKSATAILGLRMLEARGVNVFPVVIVVPSWDVADSWARELHRWAPHWRAPVMHGGSDRKPDPDGTSLTTYATLRLDAADAKGPLVRLKPATVVADELHLAKNESSKQSLALRRIAAHAATFIGLTGTPVTRDTGDVFPALQAMDPASWPSRERMIKRYVMTEEDGYGEKVQGLDPLAEPEFRAVLMGQYRRVSKADVLPQLPPKVHSVRRVELPAEWRRAYDTMADSMLAELPDEGELPVMSVLAQLTRLSQLASSACDVKAIPELDPETGLVKTRYDVTLRAPSWKIDSALGVLSERPHQQCVIFTVSSQLAVIAGTACKGAGLKTGYIIGSQGKKARRDDIDAFQAGKLDVIIATVGAGSLGITLTKASTAIFLQRSWQLDQSMQAEDRLHRLGQENYCVEICDIVAKGTVDERARELLRVKSGHLAELVRDPRIVKELFGGLRLPAVPYAAWPCLSGTGHS